jgi:hypothetical protein
VGQHHQFVRFAGYLLLLDSGLTEGQPVLSLPKGRNDGPLDKL